VFWTVCRGCGFESHGKEIAAATAASLIAGNLTPCVGVLRTAWMPGTRPGTTRGGCSDARRTTNIVFLDSPATRGREYCAFSIWLTQITSLMNCFDCAWDSRQRSMGIADQTLAPHRQRFQSRKLQIKINTSAATNAIAATRNAWAVVMNNPRQMIDSQAPPIAVTYSARGR
jgi:hypothetical protein